MAKCGYFVVPSAKIYHSSLILGRNVYIGERVLIYQAMYRGKAGGQILINDGVRIMHDCVLETGYNGKIVIEEGTWIHAKCQMNAFMSDIIVGKNVQVGPSCAFYSYDHGKAKGIDIISQDLVTKGPILIGDDVWLGHGTVVLSGVNIENGAVVAAGSVVTKNVASNTISGGVPARMLSIRHSIK